MKAPHPFSYWFARNNYFYRLLVRSFQHLVPPGKRVLNIGCTNGFVLNALAPAHGVGVDADESIVTAAQQAHPHLHFVHGTVAQIQTEQFDYILLSYTLMDTYDVQELLEQLQPFCHPATRLIILNYSHLWEPILWCAQKLGLRRPTPFKTWLAPHDTHTFLHLAGYDVVTVRKSTLLPARIPLLARLFNTWLAPLPLINHLCVNLFIAARPHAAALAEEDVTVSVLIPARNERGNIAAAVQRCPQLGRHTQLIFVEGNSTDGTWDEMQRVKAAHADKDILLLKQPGRGKGDAVRAGFAQATGDVLMILDADLTMPPEELPKFLHALLQRKGEFINGSRLVYGMESEAMRIANLVANWGFAVLFSWLLSQRLKDTLCGTKVLFKKDYEEIVANRAYFGDFDPFGDFDLLFGIAKLNRKIIDMPVHYKNRTYGSTNIQRWRSGVLLLRMWFFALRKLKFYESCAVPPRQRKVERVGTDRSQYTAAHLHDRDQQHIEPNVQQGGNHQRDCQKNSMSEKLNDRT